MTNRDKNGTIIQPSNLDRLKAHAADLSSMIAAYDSAPDTKPQTGEYWDFTRESNPKHSRMVEIKCHLEQMAGIARHIADSHMQSAD